MSDTTNSFPMIRGMLKDKYAKKPKKKAMSELEASKNPQKFMEENKNSGWKKLKGVAF